MLERDGRFYIVNSWRIGRELQLGQDGIDHVLLSFEEVSQKNFVLNELRRFACQIGLAARDEFPKALARFCPVFFEERNFRQVKARIPKLRIDSLGFQQGYFCLIIDTLAHQNHATQILGRRQVGLACIDRVEFL